MIPAFPRSKIGIAATRSFPGEAAVVAQPIWLWGFHSKKTGKNPIATTVRIRTRMYMTLKELKNLNRDCDYPQIAPSVRSKVYDSERDKKSDSRQNNIFPSRRVPAAVVAQPIWLCGSYRKKSNRDNRKDQNSDRYDSKGITNSESRLRLSINRAQHSFGCI